LKKGIDQINADLEQDRKDNAEQKKKYEEQKAKDAKELEKLRKELYSTKVDIEKNIKSSGEGEAGSKARSEGWGYMIDSITMDAEGAETLLKDLWDKYDMDKNGELSKAEIKNILIDLSKAKKAQLEKAQPKVLEKIKAKKRADGKPYSEEDQKSMLADAEAEFKKKIEKQKLRSEGAITDEELDVLFNNLDCGTFVGEGKQMGKSDGKVSKEEFCTHGKTVFLAEEMAEKQATETLQKGVEDVQKTVAELKIPLINTF